MRPSLAFTFLTLAGLAGSASAHIHLTSPLSRTDDAVGNPQKQQHCGGAPGRIAGRVQTLAPGATITVTWAETVPHPGYFRIAFQPDGEVFPIPAPNGVDGFPTEDRTGQTDTATGAIILKDRIPDGMLSAQVILPTMECNNCTLQFIQVMTDRAPYTTDAASDDIYFNCSDITLSANTPMMPDAGTGAMPDAGDGGGGGGGGGAQDTTGGCTSTHALGWGATVFVLALRRRRRGA